VSLAKKNKILLEEKAFTINDIKKCKEAFLTSTTVGVLPVIKIDNLIINNKKVGEITKKIINLYNQFLKNQTK
jgi:D-alanine transaminase